MPEYDPFASKPRQGRLEEELKLSDYAMLVEIPAPIPDDWPRNQFGVPLHPTVIRQRERTRAALGRHELAAWAGQEPKQKGPSRFTTQYTIEWGRSCGWRVLDRERYDARTKRHHDLLLGADVMFSTERGTVLAQGAGLNERAKHWARFQDRGGVPECERLRMAFVYVEFDRNNQIPAKKEWWVPTRA